LEKIKKLSKYRNVILPILDIICIAVAYLVGVPLVSDTNIYYISHYYSYRVFWTIIVSTIVYQVVFWISKSYKSIIRYEEGKDYLRYFLLCIISSLIVCIIREIFLLDIASPKLTILAGIFIGFLMVSYIRCEYCYRRILYQSVYTIYQFIPYETRTIKYLYYFFLSSSLNNFFMIICPSCV